jgi:hypothetical protein
LTGRILALGLGLIVLLGGAYATWTLRNDRVMHDTRDTTLRSELSRMRNAIRKFREDNGRNPHSLDELVPRYLRRIPVDPVTRAANWVVETEEVVVPSSDFQSSDSQSSTSQASPAPRTFVLDVHSAAGPPYSEY